MATDAGKVYFSYSGNNKPLYEFDINAKAFKKTGFILGDGWLCGVAYNSTRTKAYFVDRLGDLYLLNIKTEKFSKLGKMAPDSHSSYNYRFFHGLIISNDDKKLYSLPEMDTGSEKFYILYEYNVEKKEKKAYLTDLKGQVVGGVSSKNGYLYFHNHYYKKKYCKLIQISVIE